MKGGILYNNYILLMLRITRNDSWGRKGLFARRIEIDSRFQIVTITFKTLGINQLGILSNPPNGRSAEQRKWNLVSRVLGSDVPSRIIDSNNIMVDSDNNKRRSWDL